VTGVVTGAARVAIPVLVFHSVSDAAEPGLQRWTVSPASFRRTADHICASGRPSLTIGEVAACLRGERPLEPGAVALTFDDGYADTRGAVEALLERDIRSTVFVTTGWIGEPRRLTPQDVCALSALDGVELGAHSVSHPYLDELGPAALDAELIDSRRALQDLVGADVSSFAYPFGAYDLAVRAAVAGAGYIAAAAVKNAISHLQDDPLAIARWIVTADADHDRVEQVLRGQGAPAAWSRERLRTRAYRMARRARRRLARAAAR
jgi:peptidoglycan/xylan/chitin deacetylase (PgdA/CDA1 family)